MKTSYEYVDLWNIKENRTRFSDELNRRGVEEFRHSYYFGHVKWFISQGFELCRDMDETLAFVRKARDLLGGYEMVIRQCLSSCRLWMTLFPLDYSACQVKDVSCPAIVERNVAGEDWTVLFRSLEGVLATRRYSRRTVEAYVGWWRRFSKEVNCTPQELSEEHLRIFLEKLVLQKNIAASTQNQVLCALIMLWKIGLGRGEFDGKSLLRAPESHHIPFVLSQDQIRVLLAGASIHWRLLFSLAYGCGLRLNEALSLRIKDVDFERGLVIVHAGKGGKDRSLPFPASLRTEVEAHLLERRAIYTADLHAGNATVDLPFAMARVSPMKASSWDWQYFFASGNLLRHPDSGVLMRWHHLESTVQRNFKAVCRRSGISEQAHFHTCGILLPPTCWNMASLSGKFRLGWVIPTWKRR
jgi:site-specific recombinase XerD